MREEADKYDSRNPENEGMGEDLKGFERVIELIGGDFFIEGDRDVLAIRKFQYNDDVEIHLWGNKGSYDVMGCFEGRVAINFGITIDEKGINNITKELIDSFLSVLNFKLEN